MKATEPLWRGTYCAEIFRPADENWDYLGLRVVQIFFVSLAERHGVYMLHRTTDGVVGVEELFDEPGQLIVRETWQSVSSEMDEEAARSEMEG